jgi:mRNA-degrading endonuclease HigB of HigAB toxin-antitoxin module
VPKLSNAEVSYLRANPCLFDVAGQSFIVSADVKFFDKCFAKFFLELNNYLQKLSPKGF